MQNHGLGIHIDKIWADSTTKNTLIYLKTYSADLPNWPKYLGYLKKKLSLGVRSPCRLVFRHTIIYEAAFPFMWFKKKC